MEETKKKRLINKKSVSITVVAMLGLLIFLSGTIYNFNLPSVTAGMPERGQLNYLEITTGSVNYARVDEVFARVDGWVSDVLVLAGETVTAGQPILEMDFRGADVEVNDNIQKAYDNYHEQMASLQLTKERNALELEKNAANQSNLELQLDLLAHETFRADSVSDFEIRKNEQEIEVAQTKLDQVQILFDAGAASRQELTQAQESLNTLLSVQNNLKTLYEESQQRVAFQQSDFDEGLEKQARELNYQLDMLARERESRKLDNDQVAAQEASLKSALERELATLETKKRIYEQSRLITAPAEGVLVDLTVVSGQYVPNNQLMLTVGRDDVFIIETEISAQNSFVTTGMEVVLYNGTKSLKGTVASVVPNELFKAVRINIDPALEAELTAGETFTIEFEQTSSEVFVLVPNGALNMDSDGYFVNLVKKRDGIMGAEYYTEKLSVHIGEADSNNTAVIKGINFFEPIVVLSDRAFVEGETVNLRNVGDFFDN